MTREAPLRAAGARAADSLWRSLAAQNLALTSPRGRDPCRLGRPQRPPGEQHETTPKGESKLGIRVFLSEIRTVSNATLESADFRLYDSVNGVTRTSLDDRAREALGALGVPASDPVSGRALDLFLLHSGSLSNQGVNGLCDCRLSSGLLGGVFVGNGPNHFVSIRLFESSSGNFLPRSLSELASTLAHELGHFLSLPHTTDEGSTFFDDGFSDTPLVTDLNGNGFLDPK